MKNKTQNLSSYVAFILAFIALLLLFNNCSGLSSSESLSLASKFDSQPPTTSTPTPLSTPAPIDVASQALPATSGTPLVKQIRNGQVIATFTTLGEPFTRTHAFRIYEKGDIFELEPAVYSGQQHHAWIGPLPKDGADYDRGSSYWQIPENITIRGITRNGFRPVIKVDSAGVSYNNLGQGLLYIDTSKNLTIENIDFEGAGYSTGKAAIYLNGANGFTMRNSRVLHFSQTNGVFGTGNNTGTVLFENVETGFNGGDSGPEHNYYIGSSSTDANFTVIWRGCYSHDAYYGHTLKSRAQNNIVEGTYLKGARASSGTQAEAFLADFPNGGKLVFKNNILEKNYSGDNSNGIFIGYAMEGNNFPNASSIEITHNTFVARVLTYDSQGHSLYPMNFYYPAKIPGDTDFPVSAVVSDNIFAGFKPHETYSEPRQRYRGTNFVEVSLDQLNSDFSLK